MGDVTFFCPHCGKRSITGEDLVGRGTICPYCRGEFVVPASLKNPPATAPLPAATPADPMSALVAPPASASAAPAPSPAEAEAALAAEREERDVFSLGPTARAFLGWIVLGTLIAAAAVALAFVHPALLALAAGGLCVLAWVWVQVKSVRYRLTTQRLFLHRGLIAKHLEEVELYRVKDVTVDQRLLQRILQVGTVVVLSTDDTTPELRLEGVADPHAVKEQIRLHFRASKRRERVGVGAAEFITS